MQNNQKIVLQNNLSLVFKACCNFIFNKIFVYLVIFLFAENSFAQCAMCRASLEGEGNMKKAEAVNDGIVYLMVIPYLLAALVAFVVFRMYKNRK